MAPSPALSFTNNGLSLGTLFKNSITGGHTKTLLQLSGSLFVCSAEAVYNQIGGKEWVEMFSEKVGHSRWAGDVKTARQL